MVTVSQVVQIALGGTASQFASMGHLQRLVRLGLPTEAGALGRRNSELNDFGSPTFSSEKEAGYFLFLSL